MYLFLVDVIRFVEFAHLPGPVVWGPLEKRLRNVTTLSKVFETTRVEEWNNPGVWPAVETGRSGSGGSGSGSGGETGVGSVMMSVDVALLSQVPMGWPYTKVAVRRREGETATWVLTDDEGRAVAEVRESVGWVPRRVGEGRGLVGF